MAIFKQNKQAL